MPVLEWNRELRAFTKKCSKCKTIYIGAEDQHEAEKVLSEHFPFAVNSDGFHSQCKGCRNGRCGYQLKVSRDKMLAAQGFKCAICAKPISFTPKDGERMANVDHIHRDGTVRRLLCSRCNAGMGYVDDEKWLARAVKYRNWHNRYGRF
jgi:hypothetical protein